MAGSKDVSSSHCKGVSTLRGDCREVLRALPGESVHCVVTSPPYWGLRDYGVAGQIGLEPTPEGYVEALVGVFREVRRVLRPDGTLWLNLGDSYSGAPCGGHGHSTSTLTKPKDGRTRTAHVASPTGLTKGRQFPGLKPKDLVGIPWRVAFALQADGWWLRSDIIWHKPNPMPESVTDRPTKAHEYVFLLTKSERYAYDQGAVRSPLTEPHRQAIQHGVRPGVDTKGGGQGGGTITQNASGANLRSVWSIATHPFHGAHFATFPPDLVERCIKAGCPAGGTVLDPFGGAGTTGLVADRLGRNAIMIELNPEYAEMAEKRVRDDAPLLHGAAS